MKNINIKGVKITLEPLNINLCNSMFNKSEEKYINEKNILKNVVEFKIILFSSFFEIIKLTINNIKYVFKKNLKKEKKSKLDKIFESRLIFTNSSDDQEDEFITL